MKLLSVSLVIGALFLTSCGQSPAEPNASASVDLNKIYKWRMVTTWPKISLAWGWPLRKSLSGFVL